MKFRVGLDQLGRGMRPQLERDDVAQGRAKRRAVDVAREVAELEVLRRKEAVEAPWTELEEYGRRHTQHSDLNLLEYDLWNADDRTLVDRVLLRFTCRDCLEELDRWVTPAGPGQRCEVNEAVERLRDAMLTVERTGGRPAWAWDEVQAQCRRIDAEAFTARHREHGSVAMAEERFTHPVSVPGGTVDELEGVNLALRCSGCDEALAWWAETEEAAQRILAELRAAAG